MLFSSVEQDSAGAEPVRSPARPLLEAANIVQEFRIRGPLGDRTFRAVSRVSFQIGKGETLGLVGESGSGKTTLARALLQIPRPKSGSIWFCGVDLTRMRGQRLREHRRKMQMVFQDPFGSLNPKWRVSDIVEEPLIGYRTGDRAARMRRVEEMLELVGLPLPRFGRRRPAELSGGQCQRVAIARALASDPELIICDEAVSSLDVLTQAQILHLFRRLRQELRLSYLFISHDLAVVKQISDRVAVMYQGQLCEVASTSSLFDRPRHPYTLRLLASIPVVNRSARKANVLERQTALSVNISSGCRFRSTCPSAQALCAVEEPALRRVSGQHAVACHFPHSSLP